jgi:transcriptional regulator with XRE-family HTH domain
MLTVSSIAVHPEVSPIARTPLERARQAAGLSREQLAGAAGVSARTLFSIEREDAYPRQATQAVLCIALGLMPEVLFPRRMAGGQ